MLILTIHETLFRELIEAFGETPMKQKIPMMLEEGFGIPFHNHITITTVIK
jgi:hypothetical protein